MTKVLFEGGGEGRARKRNTHPHDAEADELTSRFDPGHGFLLVPLKRLVCCPPLRLWSIPAPVFLLICSGTLLAFKGQQRRAGWLSAVFVKADYEECNFIR